MRGNHEAGGIGISAVIGGTIGLVAVAGVVVIANTGGGSEATAARHIVTPTQDPTSPSATPSSSAETSAALSSPSDIPTISSSQPIPSISFSLTPAETSTTPSTEATSTEPTAPPSSSSTPPRASTTPPKPVVKPVIVIDPGHSGTSHQVTDPQTGIIDSDYPNHPEMEDVYTVAQLVRAKLLHDGYTVIMTKNSPNATVSLRQRATIANNAHAALAISIHDTAGNNGGLPFSSANNIVYDQRDGLYRQRPDGRKVVFNNPRIAALSRKFALLFQKNRAAAEGHSIQLVEKVTSINGRGLAPGDIWMVQLFSQVPWVYNEAGGNSAGQSGLNTTDKQKYANGLIRGIEASVPIPHPTA